MRRLGLTHRKYHFTPELTAALREAYTAPNKATLTSNLKGLQRMRPWPRWVFAQEAERLGITLAPRRPFSNEEDAYLRQNMELLSVAAMARSLHRGERVVESRCRHLQDPQGPQENYTAGELAARLGVRLATVASWQRRGLFGRTRESGADHISGEKVVRFIQKHASEYSLRRVNQAWFVAVLFGLGDEEPKGGN
jgi:hypothetical protein